MHSPTPKRTVLVILGALLLLCVAVLLITLSTQRYVAVSMVLVKPYTNAFFAQSFESEVIQKTPTVLSVRAVPSISAIIPPSTPVATNGVIIRIEAFGPSVVEAENAANEAAGIFARWHLPTTRLLGRSFMKRGLRESIRFFTMLFSRPFVDGLNDKTEIIEGGPSCIWRNIC